MAQILSMSSDDSKPYMIWKALDELFQNHIGFAIIRARRKRILKIQASLTAHWHDKGADWRGLVHSPAHRRSRLSDSVKNGNALRTVHNAALPAR